MRKDTNTQAAKAVLETAKDGRLPEDGIIEIKGVKVKIEAVPAMLLDEVTSRIKNPQPPMIMVEEKGRKEPNPNDPTYLREMQEAENTRNRAAMDAMILFGVELIEGLPDDEGWLKKLRYLEKRDAIDLDEYDLEDELDKEFLYKRYILSNTKILNLITKASGISAEEVANVEDSFPDKKA